MQDFIGIAAFRADLIQDRDDLIAKFLGENNTTPLQNNIHVPSFTSHSTTLQQPNTTKLLLKISVSNGCVILSFVISTNTLGCSIRIITNEGFYISYIAVLESRFGLRVHLARKFFQLKLNWRSIFLSLNLNDSLDRI